MANIINGTDTGSGGLITTGDSSDELQLQTAETARVTLTNTAVVVNEDGNDVDFRVEGDTDANLLFVDAGNDRVGVGTNAPASLLHVSSSGSPQFRVASTDGGGGLLAITASSTGNSLFDSSADYVFRAGPELARLTTDGYLRMASGGIQFNGNTAAANALDDYEEGTWTPVLTASVTNPTYTASTAQGYYTKIGNICQFSVWLAVNITNAGSGTAYISLPFTSASTYTAVTIAHETIAAQGTENGYVATDDSFFVLTLEDSTNNASFTTGNPLYLMASGVYRVA